MIITVTAEYLDATHTQTHTHSAVNQPDSGPKVFHRVVMTRARALRQPNQPNWQGLFVYIFRAAPQVLNADITVGLRLAVFLFWSYNSLP